MELPSSGSRPAYRTSCTECQRRKQKCNREWPCNHCQKRKVAEICRFSNPLASVSATATDRTTPAISNKRSRSLHDDDDDDDEQNNEYESDDDADNLGLEALGYMSGTLLDSLTMEPKNMKKGSEKLDWVTVNTCPKLRDALEILPQRPQMDGLLQMFFNNVNYHYYIIYPPRFLEEYQQWWDRTTKQQPVTLQWTCLLIMMLSCAMQHVDAEMKVNLEQRLGDSADSLSKRYYDTVKDLAVAITSGRYHVINVQRTLHSIYWHKAEAQFPEAWHGIGEAVREAQELGFHSESDDGLPEFEREVRRRLWCILSTWDWQFASGLQRPTMIDHGDVDVALPTLTLENVDPSPLLHMKLQAQAITTLAARFGAPKNVKTHDEILEYKTIIEDWLAGFPAVYSTENPDLSRDSIHPWVTSHRFYIHTMAYLMILNPIRLYMGKYFDENSSAEDLRIRDIGVYYSLRNLDTTRQWTEYSSHRDGRYHFIIFSLFDTATVLAAAIIKDRAKTIPRRDEILEGIQNAYLLLRRVNKLSKTAQVSYDILSRVVKRLPRPRRSKKARVQLTPGEDASSASASTSPSTFGNSGTTGSSPHTAANTPNSGAPSIESQIMPQQQSFDMEPSLGDWGPPPAPPPLGDAKHEQVPSHMVHPDMSMFAPSMSMMPQHTDLQPPMPEMIPAFGYDELITDDVMGHFSLLWDHNSLSLPFINSQVGGEQMQ
ncbi:putative transcriptional regulatory protein-like protein [Emericellopsis cladophorae]|uniref:Transcriptional regulatory protein-like protein n=1 Tax=Emericellopsis cladophorae TaxID=2686198 RepID=A0A9P9XVU2_9HYPO|nr:putative transcriptional regulatory protein-like protein [Emericellopsis cladophorae]KAI6778690.1 putative transcriptional regulatory protein-like protein [Emericellopsis cladophorae]